MLPNFFSNTPMKSCFKEKTNYALSKYVIHDIGLKCSPHVKDQKGHNKQYGMVSKTQMGP